MSAERPLNNEVVVIYDGHCPFCANYVRLYRLRKLVGKVTLVDARSGSHPALDEVRRRGLDLDEGMAVRWQDRLYYGSEALHVLALLGSEDGVFNKVNRWLFSRPQLGRQIYPWMVAGRKLTLRLLGRKLIAEG
jgi:predicted DCC family thiol-disulfide oxidoreductase YuxK